MKKILAVIVLLVIIVGGLYYLNTQQEEELLLDQYKCNIDDVDYYIYNQLIYFNNKNDEDFILADFGSYQLKPTKDGWTLNFFKNKAQSTYVTLFDWIDIGAHPTAEKLNVNHLKNFHHTLIISLINIKYY